MMHSASFLGLEDFLNPNFGLEGIFLPFFTFEDALCVIADS